MHLHFVDGILERRVVESGVGRREMSAGQVHDEVLELSPRVIDFELATQAVEPESAVLVESQTVHVNNKIIVLDARKLQVGSQVGDVHMVNVKCAGCLAWLIENVVGKVAVVNDGIVDAYVVRCGRLAGLGLEFIDYKLQVSGTVLVGARHRAVQAVNLGKIENHLALDN